MAKPSIGTLQDLTLAAQTRRDNRRACDDRRRALTGTIPVTQTTWGIKPYRG
jgi:hypothetical protein